MANQLGQIVYPNNLFFGIYLMPLLTQSDFSLFLNQPIHLWAKYNDSLLPQTHYRSFSLNQDLKNLGYEYINQILMPNFSDYKLSTNISLQSNQTQAKIDALIERGETESVLCLIKGANAKNKGFIEQLAFQVLTLEKIPQRIFLILLNSRYTRLTQLNLEQLFCVTEVTSQVLENLTQVKAKVLFASEVITLKNSENLETCNNPQTCPCPQICHPNLPDYSIYDATSLNSSAKVDLKNRGILNLVDIPKEYQSNPRLITQINLTKKKSSNIDKNAIKKRLNEVKYPITFLDYEAYAFPTPLFPGYWPQSSVVFQYSMQILEKDHSLKSKNFLHTIKDNPTPSIIKSLKKDIPKTGSIVVWDQGLEAQVHQHLARLQTQDLLFLLGLNQRFFDLQDIFKTGLYQDYRFKGSLSLKKILPVLVPEFNHQDLNISSGLEAATAWYTLVFEKDKENDPNKVIKSLKDYCQLDTLGCLKIYEKLLNLLD